MKKILSLLVLTLLMGGATVAQADSITVHLFGMSFSLNPSGQTIVSNATIYLGDTFHLQNHFLLIE